MVQQRFRPAPAVRHYKPGLWWSPSCCGKPSWRCTCDRTPAASRSAARCPSIVAPGRTRRTPCWCTPVLAQDERSLSNNVFIVITLGSRTLSRSQPQLTLVARISIQRFPAKIFFLKELSNKANFFIRNGNSDSCAEERQRLLCRQFANYHAQIFINGQHLKEKNCSATTKPIVRKMARIYQG